MTQTTSFRQRLRAAYSHMNFHSFCCRAGFLPDDYARSKWAEWQTLSNAFAAFDDDTLEKILGTPTQIPIFIILGQDSNAQKYGGTILEFVEVENEDGFSVAIDAPMTQYPGKSALFRLGPFLASVREPGLEAVPGVPAKPDQSPRKDGTSKEPGPLAEQLLGDAAYDESPNQHLTSRDIFD